MFCHEKSSETSVLKLPRFVTSNVKWPVGRLDSPSFWGISGEKAISRMVTGRLSK